MKIKFSAMVPDLTTIVTMSKIKFYIRIGRTWELWDPKIRTKMAKTMETWELWCLRRLWVQLPTRQNIIIGRSRMNALSQMKMTMSFCLVKMKKMMWIKNCRKYIAWGRVAELIKIKAISFIGKIQRIYMSRQTQTKHPWWRTIIKNLSSGQARKHNRWSNKKLRASPLKNQYWNWTCKPSKLRTKISQIAASQRTCLTIWYKIMRSNWDYRFKTKGQSTRQLRSSRPKGRTTRTRIIIPINHLC